MFSIKESVGYGWDKLKQHFWKLVAATACMVGIGMVTSVFSGAMERNHAAGFGIMLFIGMIAVIILSLMIKIGYTKFALAMHDGEVMPVKGIFDAYGVFWKYIGVSILQGLIILGGMILLIVPGIVWAIKYSFAPLIVIDTKAGIKASLKESGNITNGAKWKLLGFYIVLGLINMVGYILLGLGLLASIPLSTLAYIHVYRKLSQKNAAVSAPAEPAVPTSPTEPTV